MARQTRTSTAQTRRATMPPAGRVDPEARWQMIQEAAYYHYVQRGYAPGDDVNDWLAAEAEIDAALAAERTAEAASPPETAFREYGVQEGGKHGSREDEALKRMVRQHPQRDISRVESMEVREAPPRE